MMMNVLLGERERTVSPLRAIINTSVPAVLISSRTLSQASLVSIRYPAAGARERAKECVCAERAYVSTNSLSSQSLLPLLLWTTAIGLCSPWLSAVDL